MFCGLVWCGVVCGMCHVSVFVCAGEAACISGPTSPKRWQFSLIEVNCTMNSPIQTHAVWNITLAAAATAAQKMHYTLYDVWRPYYNHFLHIYCIHTLLLLLFCCCCPLAYFPHEFVSFSMHFSCAHAQQTGSFIGDWSMSVQKNACATDSGPLWKTTTSFHNKIKWMIDANFSGRRKVVTIIKTITKFEAVQTAQNHILHRRLEMHNIANQMNRCLIEPYP